MLKLIFVVLIITAIQAFRFRPSSVKQFKYRSYGEIVNHLLTLEKKYPEYLELYTAQEAFGVASPSSLSCTRNGKKEPCQQYILRITDESTLPDRDRPEVFFSGALHGDERVGPIAVTELATLLLDHASRSDGNPWIKQLVQTRSIFIMPTTNAYGYDRNSRTEDGVDPNRDFNYLKSDRGCMQTITARSVNELWIRHLFQLAITFHGGMRAVSYEWGSTNHYSWSGWSRSSEKSPDHQAQWFLGLAMSKYGGAFKDGEFYPHGPMNDIVYGVEGGMEDWGYAASWENQVTSKKKPINTCNPTTYGGYSPSKTKYNNASHRAFNILVETSNSKQPYESELGTNEGLLDENLDKYLSPSHSVGHVARNVRLSLLYIDLVQPYINWLDPLPLTLDLNQVVELNWEVMGAFTVDETMLSSSISSDFTGQVRQTTPQDGPTRWRHEEHGKIKLQSNRGKFKASLSFGRAGKYYVRAAAKVDQNWLEQGVGKDLPAPNVVPQTHIVNARTRDDWEYENNGHRVKGQVYYYSSTITLTVR